MKLVKMSLLAATLIASSAFAIDNVKVSGDAKLYYATHDDTNNNIEAGLFDKTSSDGQAALGLGLTADLTEGVSAGVHLTALSALGLTNIVSNVWEAGLQDEFWFDEAWIAGTAFDTTVKVGRMTLDTPLAFTETWSIAKNTFEAGVLLNQSIPDTTLVGAYIGESNAGGVGQYANVVANLDGNQNTNFGLVNGGKGAYAVGAVNNSWKPLTAQAWFYNLPSHAQAYWVQGDIALDFGLNLGAQYTGIEIQDNTFGGVGEQTNDAFAVMAGYELKDIVTVSAAFSQTGTNNNGLRAGFNVFGQQSKLYTEAWWNYGYNTRADTTAINVTVKTPEELTYVGLGLYVTQDTVGENGTGVDQKEDMMEVTLEASKSFGPLDVALLYIMTDAEDQNVNIAGEGESYNTVQAYLTYNF